MREGWNFAVKHMDAVRDALSSCPAGLFMDFATATPQQDMEQATDLVMLIEGGTFAVRVRRHKTWKMGKKWGRIDWSVRYYCRGYKTEIDKLREGFGDWYFYGWYKDDRCSLIGWVILDLSRVRECGILDREWDVHPNGDGTSGMYIPMGALRDEGCIVATHKQILQAA